MFREKEHFWQLPAAGNS